MGIDPSTEWRAAELLELAPAATPAPRHLASR
jgi:hypothetical protein